MITIVTNTTPKPHATLFSQLVPGELFYWVGAYGPEPIKMKLDSGFIYLHDVRTFGSPGVSMRHDVNDWAVIRVTGELTVKSI